MAGILFRGLLGGTGGGGGGSLPSPSTLLGWWKADAGVTKDGSDKVSQWADQSGNGYDFTQATGARQPTWEASVQNGLPGIRFPSGTGLVFPSGLPYVGAFLYVVKYPTATFSPSSVIQSGGTGGWYGSNGTAQWGGLPAFLGLYRRNGVTRANNETISPLNAAHYLYVAMNFSSYDMSGMVLGNWTSYDNEWSGHICEAAYWSNALSSTDYAAAESYAASRYAI